MSEAKHLSEFLQDI